MNWLLPGAMLLVLIAAVRHIALRWKFQKQLLEHIRGRFGGVVKGWLGRKSRILQFKYGGFSFELEVRTGVLSGTFLKLTAGSSVSFHKIWIVADHRIYDSGNPLQRIESSVRNGVPLWTNDPETLRSFDEGQGLREIYHWLHVPSCSNTKFVVLDSSWIGTTSLTSSRSEFALNWVEKSLALYERWVVHAHKEIQFLEIPAGTKTEKQSKSLNLGQSQRCGVCGSNQGNDWVRCAQCDTFHHRECWNYNGRCSTFGCGRSEAVEI